MPILRVALLAVLLSLVAAPASADAIGGPCPSGQIWQANPTPPGAMHHGGGQCVPDPHAAPAASPSASSCSASPARTGAPLALGLALAAWASSRRVRVRPR